MDKFFVVAKREYLERVRSRWFIIMTLFVPALIAGSFLFPLWLSMRSTAGAGARNILILDATGARVGRHVADILRGDSSIAAQGAAAASSGPRVRELAPVDLPAAEAEATREVMRPHALTGYLVLDDSTLNGARARYAGRNASSIVELDKIRSAVRQSIMIVRLQREGVKPATITEVSRISLRMPAERIDEHGRGGSGQAAIFLGIGVGILLLMSIMMHGQQVLRGVLEEKTSRVAEVVISSVKPETLLAGKVAGAGAVGLTQQLLWIAISAYLINMVLPIVLKSSPALAAESGAPAVPGLALGGLTIGLFVTVILYFLLGFVFYASLLAAAGSMVNTEQDAQQAAMPVTIPLIVTWLFVNPVLLNPNGTAARVLSWIPFSSPIIMPMRMGLTAVSWASIAGSLVVCVFGCLLAVWLAARIYRVGMLMYGKRPSLPELARWIRYA